MLLMIGTVKNVIIKILLGGVDAIVVSQKKHQIVD